MNIRTTGIATMLGFAMIASPASAQRYWVDLGVNAGFSLHTAALGADQGFAGGDAKFKAGWLVGSQFTLWPAARVGLRANLNYSDRAFEADAPIGSSVNLWSGSGDVMLRLKAPNETWEGSETLPFVALGLGRKWINPSGDATTCYDQGRGELWSCLPFEQGPGTGNTFALGEWKEALMILAGVGADFRVSPRWLFRLEVNDRIYKPQIQAVSGYLGGNLYGIPDGEANESKTIHELGVQAGVHLALGMRGPTQMVAPPPPPPQPQPQQQQPPPPPPPAPPPPPRVDNISVCVLDTSAPNGRRMVDAQYRYASNDTVVMVNGNAQPLRSTVGTINTAGNAEWFVRGTPFVMQMGRFREEFVTYGRPELVSCPNLAYVGMVNGYPVYVNPNDVAAFNTQLQAAVGRSNGDLAAALGGNAQLRQQFDAIRTIWVPINPVGPMMQALQRQEQVRKGQQQ